MARVGLKTLRFTNAEVLERPGYVMSVIREAVRERMQGENERVKRTPEYTRALGL